MQNDTSPSELKEYESKILGAEDKIYAMIESKLYQDLVYAMSDYIHTTNST